MSNPQKFDPEWDMRDKQDHFAYIMGHLNADDAIVGPTKVGISMRPLQRLKQVQADEPGKIVLVADFGFWKRAHAYRVEQAFHRVCKDYRIRGEWFDIPPYHAVAIMARNMEVFTDKFLQPQDTSDVFSAWDYMNIPGKVLDLDLEEFIAEHTTREDIFG